MKKELEKHINLIFTNRPAGKHTLIRLIKEEIDEALSEQMEEIIEKFPENNKIDNDHDENCICYRCFKFNTIEEYKNKFLESLKEE